MNRRDFLKLSGIVSAMLVLPLVPLAKELGALATVTIKDLTYRGTPDGQVLVSPDEGQTWNLLTDFGPAFSVFSLSAISRDRMVAHLGFEGHSFGLVWSPDERVWRTG